jgi:hypothetical protein
LSALTGDSSLLDSLSDMVDVLKEGWDLGWVRDG